MKKGRELIFHWRGGCLTKEVLKELLALMEQAAAQRGKHAAVSLNWPQAVLQVSFRDAEPARELVVEEANEGERCG